MNQITKHTELPTFLCVGLTEIQKTYLISARSKKVAQIEGNELMNILLEIIKNIHLETGIPVQGFEASHQIAHLKAVTISFYDCITNDFKYKNLGIDEIRQACKNGTKGMYGEWYGRIALVTFLQWIDSYKLHDDRIQAIKKATLNAENAGRERREPTPIDLERIFNEALDMSRKIYAQSGYIQDAGSGVYNGLIRRNLIPKLILDRRSEFVQIASDKIYRQHEHISKTAFNRQERKDALKVLDSLMELESVEKVEVEANRLMLAEYFKL